MRINFKSILLYAGIGIWIISLVVSIAGPQYLSRTKKKNKQVQITTIDKKLDALRTMFVGEGRWPAGLEWPTGETDEHK